MAANSERGFCPQKRSAAVVPSGRVRRTLWTAVKHARFLRWSSPRSGWFRSERYPWRPSPGELERWNTSASSLAWWGSTLGAVSRKAAHAPPGADSGIRRRAASARSGVPADTGRVWATRSREQADRRCACHA